MALTIKILKSGRLLNVYHCTDKRQWSYKILLGDRIYTFITKLSHLINTVDSMLRAARQYLPNAPSSRSSTPPAAASQGRAGQHSHRVGPKMQEDLYPSSRNGTRPYGPSDSGRTCVLPVGTDWPARRRPAAATARLQCCTGPILSRPFVPTKRHCQNAATILLLCSKHKHKLRRLRCVPSLRIRPTFACSLFLSGESCLGHRTEQDPAALQPSPWLHMSSPPPSRRATAAGAAASALRATFC
jgi:hypothetical protein